jgi:hypothetical protein
MLAHCPAAKTTCATQHQSPRETVHIPRYYQQVNFCTGNAEGCLDIDVTPNLEINCTVDEMAS